MAIIRDQVREGAWKMVLIVDIERDERLRIFLHVKSVGFLGYFYR